MESFSWTMLNENEESTLSFTRRFSRNLHIMNHLWKEYAISM